MEWPTRKPSYSRRSQIDDLAEGSSKRLWPETVAYIVYIHYS